MIQKNNTNSLAFYFLDVVNEMIGKATNRILKKENKWYLGTQKTLILLSFDKNNNLSNYQKLETIAEIGMTAEKIIEIWSLLPGKKDKFYKSKTKSR